jgi:signal transduction histidine kinase
MPPEKEFVVFRILQENLNNILKHSRCKNVFTKIVYDEKEFTLIQTDDGVGYDLTEVNKRMDESAGSGLINMQRRAELINATFSLNSQPLKGTQLSLKIENLNNEKN